MIAGQAKRFIGLDLGGTKIEAALVDEDGRVVARHREPSPRGDYKATLEIIARLVTRIDPDGPPNRPVGVGIPGSASPASGLIRNANSTWLNGTALEHDLAARLGRPVRLANDADCFALSEAVDGAGAGAASVFGVILGTGVGGGIVIGGKLLSGPNAIAGEWGHNPLPWPNPDEYPGGACYCGRRGCIETWLSGPALSTALEQEYGDALNTRNIDQAYGAGDPRAVAALEIYCGRAARALAQVINILDPEVIVLGGGLSNIGALYELIPAHLPAHVFSDVMRTRIVPNAHGDSGGVRGAAWLWRDAPE